MVSLKLAPFKSSLIPLKNAISSKRNTIRRKFSHVSCSDDEIRRYFKDAASAHEAMNELGKRSWEYQYEFAVEMSKRCQQVMGKDPNLIEALDVFEQWYSLYIWKC
jgi:hypothetical protein